MRQLKLQQIFLFAIFSLIIAACKPTAKVNQLQSSKINQATNSKSVCDQTIKYYSNKIKRTNGSEENITTEIIINPSTKLITLTSEAANQEKTNFETVIVNMDCNFNADLTAGYSSYTGYIKQRNGTTTNSKIKLEPKDDGLVISSADESDQGEFTIVIYKWEILAE